MSAYPLFEYEKTLPGRLTRSLLSIDAADLRSEESDMSTSSWSTISPEVWLSSCLSVIESVCVRLLMVRGR